MWRRCGTWRYSEVPVFLWNGHSEIPIVTAVALVSRMEGSPIEAFFVRSEAKDHGTGSQVEGRLQPGSRVAIVDDVCTSGGSLFTAIQAARKRHRLHGGEGDGDTGPSPSAGGGEELRRRGYDFQALLEADAEGAGLGWWSSKLSRRPSPGR